MNYHIMIDPDITDGQRYVVVEEGSMRAVARGCLYPDAVKIKEALKLYDATHPPEALSS